MMNRSYPMLPVPEIVDSNLNHSFKFNMRDDQKRNRKPPKLYPKECSFIRNGHHEVHAISFKDQISSSIATSTPKSSSSSLDSLMSSFYDHNKSDSYFEQCFETIRKLGEGSFGEVFKVRSRDDGNFYAIKKTKQIFRSESHRRERLEEVKRYEQFSTNEHCVTLYKAWEQNDLLFMQIELCWGSVEDYVEKIKHVPESFVWSFLLDMLLALQSLHDQNLAHLDIKLDNILITDEKHCKLADFGLVFDLSNSPRIRAIEGDSRYLAPELMQGNYGRFNDIFSLGISVLELACNLELPANGKLWQELRTLVLPEVAMNLLSPELQGVVRAMMEPDPAKRPSVDELLKLPKLRSLHFKRKGTKISQKCVQTFSNAFQIIKCYLLFLVFIIYEFFKLEKKGHVAPLRPRSGVRICVQNYDENSDDDTSFKTSLNTSRASKASHLDDDNNNDSNITPTLNNSIPRITPELLIVNSTPLNHMHHQNGLSSRKGFGRALTKLSFDTTSASPVIRTPRNMSPNRDSFTCKKLCFQDAELEDF